MTSLDDPRLYASTDPRGMGALIGQFADHVARAAALADELRLPPEPPRALLLVGMGGSAIAGDLLAALWREEAPFPILVVRGYELPAWVGADTQVVVSSYSGETEETLAAFAAARRRDARLLVVTSGGRLAESATRDGLSRITLPGGLQPRAALPYLLVPLVAAGVRAYPRLGRAGNPVDAVPDLEALGRELAPTASHEVNLAKQLAGWIGERTPVVYGTDVTGAVAHRWRTQFEENAKRLALSGELPEMNHNTIEAWGAGPGAGWAPVLLRDSGEHPRVARRAELTRAVVGARAPMREVWSRGGSRLARLLSLVLVGDWTSYYLAVARAVDPWSVATLEAFKRRLAGNGG